VITVRDGKGALCGLLPLYQARARLGRVVPFRVLRYMADHATGHEYPDWIARRDVESVACETMAGALATASDWDCLWITRIAGWTGAIERMRAACEAVGFHAHTRPRQFGMVPLPATLDEYFKTLSSQRRYEIRNRMRRILGRSGVRIVRCEQHEDAPRLLDALFDLHHRRRLLVGDAGAFHRKPEEADFYRSFVSVALDRGWLRLFGLEDQGDIKAVQIGYVYGQVFNSLQEGFDPTYEEKGVGNALRIKVIEACLAEGIREFDFLGEMSEHKRLWRANERIGYDLFVGRRSLKNRLMFTREIWPTGRYFTWSSDAA
jgi:CelD/BcsL family acetyltransferase involved in cellulose biosynthesis